MTSKPPSAAKRGTAQRRKSNRPLKVFFLTSEVSPVAKTGGLADVSRALPLALAESGLDVRVGTVAFRGVDALPGFSLQKTFVAPTPAGLQSFRLFVGTLAPGLVPVYALDPGGLFNRPALYGEGGGEYPDNFLRFSLWTHGLLALPRLLGFSPDIFHANDWQSALAIPLLPHLDPLGVVPRTVMSIHNIAYQGIYPLEDWPLTGLSPSYNHFDALEYHGRLSLLKGGIQFADMVTTVSPSYRSEVLHEPMGFGLSSALRHRGDRFVGLLNGIDAEEWNPESDPHLPVHYGAETLGRKDGLKETLLREWGLSGEGPLFGVVSRMVSQKGLDLLARALLSEASGPGKTGSWVVLGSGDPEIEGLWREVARRSPGRVHLTIGFDEGLSHRIMGACDFLVVPSAYEPCGLTQMYAMRYGTLPLVNPTGGLMDTVVDGETGLWLGELSEEGILEGIKRASILYGSPRKMKELRRQAMKVDSSWLGRAREYEKLYRETLALPAWHLPRT
ncbi:MAG: glycogen synthase [Leptospirillia bacterium]